MYPNVLSSYVFILTIKTLKCERKNVKNHLSTHTVSAQVYTYTHYYFLFSSWQEPFYCNDALWQQETFQSARTYNLDINMLQMIQGLKFLNDSLQYLTTIMQVFNSNNHIVRTKMCLHSHIVRTWLPCGNQELDQ